MKKITFLLIAAMAVSLFQSCSGRKVSAAAATVAATTTDTVKTSTAKTDSSAVVLPDTAFADKAAIAGMAEVELGKMAAAKGLSAKVKDFGKMMVIDHVDANAELMIIAKGRVLCFLRIWMQSTRPKAIT